MRQFSPQSEPLKLLRRLLSSTFLRSEFSSFGLSLRFDLNRDSTDLVLDGSLYTSGNGRNCQHLQLSFGDWSMIERRFNLYVLPEVAKG